MLAVGNDSDPAGWAAAPAPRDITVRAGQGIGGSDRVTITWADGRILGSWLEVTVLATAATGLPQDDVFYFGNAPGEAGDFDTHAMVTAADEILARNFAHGLADLATIDDALDFNRDRLVNVADRIIARNGRTDLTTALQLITPASPGGLGASAEVAEETPDFGWLAEIQQPTTSNSSRKEIAASAVDALLAIYGMDE